MKKELILICIILFIILINYSLAVNWEKEFNKNPDKTFEELENNPYLWENPEVFEIAFRIDSEKSANLINQEISKKYSSLQEIKIGQESFWLENQELTALIEEKIKSNNEILNKNIFLKREWFAKKEVIDEGAKIESFDGKIIKTSGSESTEFDLTDDFFFGSKILPSGKLVLKDKTEIILSKIIKDENGELNFNGGEIKLADAFNSKFSILNGKVVKNGKTFLSENNNVFHVDSKNEKLEITGADIIEKDSLDKIISKFSGTIKINKKITLGDSTKYTSFLNNRESRAYIVDKETEINSFAGGCDGSISCIEETNSGRNLKLIAKNNLIKIESYDGNLKNLEIEKIDDDSKVIFSENKDFEMTITKNPITLKGNFAQLSTNVKSSFTDESGETHDFYFKDGSIIQCSFPCKNIGLNSIIEKRLKELKDSERDNYLKEIRSKYGNQAQIWYLDYLVVGGNPRVYKGVVSASQQLYERTGKEISPEFLYTGAVAEGLDRLISDGEEGVNVKGIKGQGYLGLDNFGTDAPILRAGGYLPKDFIEGEGYWKYPKENPGGIYVLKNGKYGVEEFSNEKNELVLSGEFKNLEDVFVAKAAEYAWRQDILLNDLKKTGINKNELSKDEIDFWTYVYYNSGQASGKQMLESYNKKGYLQTEDYIWKKPDDFWKDSHQFANRRMANLKLVKESGIIFPQR